MSFLKVIIKKLRVVLVLVVVVVVVVLVVVSLLVLEIYKMKINSLLTSIPYIDRPLHLPFPAMVSFLVPISFI
jgi:hypothetical protein